MIAQSPTPVPDPPAGAAPASKAGASSPPGLDRVVQALRCLSAYHVPEIRAFIERCGLEPLRRRADLLGQVLDLLLPGSLEPNRAALHAAFDYVDEIKEHGEQLIFLFRLRPDERAYLTDLADPAWLAAHLRERGVEDCFGRGSLVVLPEGPTPARVERRSEPRDELVFKWVDTRVWLQKRGAGARRFVMDRHSGRAVSFFRIDLDTGEAELRTEAFRTNARPPLEEELRELLDTVRSVVELDRFEPVLMEPVIHRLVLDPGSAKIREWRVDWAEGGRLEGRGEPSFVQGLPLRFGHFVAEEAAVDWPVGGEGEDAPLVRVNLDARRDILEIPGRWPRPVLGRLLATLRGLAQPRLKVSELSELAKERSDLEPALEKIEQQIDGRGKREVTASEVAGDGLVTDEQVEEAFRILAARSPKVFHLRYRLACPTFGEPETDDGGIRWYSTRSEVPSTVPCSFAEATVHTQTDGMVEAVLDFDRELKGPQLALRLHKAAVRRNMARDEPASETPRKIAVTLFMVLVVGLTVAFFLWLGSLFDEPWVGPVLVKAVSAVVGGEVAIVLAALGIVGDPARDWFRDLLIFVAEKISSGRSERQGAAA